MRSRLESHTLNGSQRIAVLFTRLSGYMSECLLTLKERYDPELLVIRRPPSDNAPFDDRHFSWIDALYDRTELDLAKINSLLDEFDPTAVLIAGWADRHYLQAARRVRRRGVPVIAGSDAQWSGSLRQQIGRVVAPWYLRSAVDVLWVAGERQRQLARMLGYEGPACWSGYYACDWTRFAAVYGLNGVSRPRAFLFVGRYVPEKGFDQLVEAYRMYRAQVSEPWTLTTAGAGKEEARLAGQEGVVNYGFVQPDRLPSLFQETGAFVLPSRREPWGVVIQEAAASGLPLICSTACGAAVHLLQDNYNGYLVQSGSSSELARAMVRLTEASAEARARMGRRSHELSGQFTSDRWASTFMDGLAALRDRTQSPPSAD